MLKIYPITQNREGFFTNLIREDLISSNYYDLTDPGDVDTLNYDVQKMFEDLQEIEHDALIELENALEVYSLDMLQTLPFSEVFDSEYRWNCGNRAEAGEEHLNRLIKEYSITIFDEFKKRAINNAIDWLKQVQESEEEQQ